MNNCVNFEDNIFALHTQVRMIRDLLALEADPDLFLEKTLGDLEFIDLSLGRLLQNLEENTRLIDREEQFENLSELERRFSLVLSEMLNGRGSLSVENFPLIREKIGLLRERSGERRGRIDREGGRPEAASPEPLVSGAELSELLKALE
jgi:hypothetical protein